MILPRTTSAAITWYFLSTIPVGFQNGSGWKIQKGFTSEPACRNQCDITTACLQYVYYTTAGLTTGSCYFSPTIVKNSVEPVGGDKFSFGQIYVPTQPLTALNYNQATIFQSAPSSPSLSNSYYLCSSTGSTTGGEGFTTCGNPKALTLGRAGDGSFCLNAANTFTCDPATHYSTQCVPGSGIVTDSKGVTTCSVCDSTHTSPGGNSVCFLNSCPAGTGLYNAGTSAASCNQCQQNRAYGLSGNNVPCVGCGLNTLCSSTTGQVTQCPESYIITGSGAQSSCASCSATDNISDGTTTVCNSCPTGSHCTMYGGIVSCKPGFGYNYDTVYGGACNACDSTHYQPNDFSNNYCSPCSASGGNLCGPTTSIATGCVQQFQLIGTLGTSTATCKQCSLTQWSAGGLGSPICQDCPAYSYCGYGSPAIIICVAGNGLTLNPRACKPCVGGYSDGTVDCKPCATGSNCGPGTKDVSGCSSKNYGFVAKRGTVIPNAYCVSCTNGATSSSATAFCDVGGSGGGGTSGPLICKPSVGRKC